MIPVLAAAQIGMGAADALIGAIPGKQEKAMRQQLKQDEARLAGGHGMSAGQRDAAAAGALGTINARQQQMLAQMARGSAGGSGASGMQQANIASTLKAGQEASRGVASDVNRLDRAAYDTLKAGVQQQRANMMQVNQQNQKQIMSGIGTAMNGTQSIQDWGEKPGGDAQVDTASSGSQLLTGRMQAPKLDYASYVNKVP